MCSWCGGPYGDAAARYCGNCGVLPACGITIPAHNRYCMRKRRPHGERPR